MNWQNIPRDDKTIKRAVLSKRGALVFADYSQVEPRLTAYFAAKVGHPAFAEQIRAGVDSYTAVAKLVTGKDEVSDEERQTWKRVYLSLLYGGGTTTIMSQLAVSEYLAREFGTSKGAAREIIDAFHQGWPAVRALQNMVQAVTRDRGYIRTPWGRHLHMEAYGEHKLLNKLIQGSAADLMKQAILKVDHGIRAFEFEARMVSVVHDELILDAPAGEVGELAHKLPIWMSMPADEVGINEIVPITTDVEVSYSSWADKSELALV